MNIKKMENKELKELAYSLFHSVYNDGCFSAKDVILCEMALQELEKRGYEVIDYEGLKIRK